MISILISELSNIIYTSKYFVAFINLRYILQSQYKPQFQLVDNYTTLRLSECITGWEHNVFGNVYTLCTAFFSSKIR